MPCSESPASQMRTSGVDITKNINNTVKETSRNLVKQDREKIGATAENVTKVVTSPTKDEIKKRTNH